MQYNDDKTKDIVGYVIPLLPIIALHGLLWPLIEKHLIRTEEIIAYISDYSTPFFIPMGVLISVLVYLFVKKFLWSKQRNNIYDPFIKTDKKDRKRRKIIYTVVFSLLFVICSLIMCMGTLQRTVITPDYTIKTYNFVGKETTQYKPEDVKFVKIYPYAKYERYGGFYDIEAYIEIYINENDCFVFRNYDFDSFDKIVDTKNAIQSQGIKVYIADKASNEPDPDTDYLSEDDLLLIENFYKEYEKLK